MRMSALRDLGGCKLSIGTESKDIDGGVEFFCKNGWSGNCDGEGEDQGKSETLQFGGALHVHNSVELLGTEGRVREVNSQRSIREKPLVIVE